MVWQKLLGLSAIKIVGSWRKICEIDELEVKIRIGSINVYSAG